VALADHAPNLGTTTTVLHGNAAGQPTYGAVDLANDTASTVLPMNRTRNVTRRSMRGIQDRSRHPRPGFISPRKS
jgi:hypothetical protein